MPVAPLQRFIHAVHRRMLLLRTLERIGLALLLGSAANLVLAPILIARRQSTGELSLVLLSLTAFAGLAWSIVRRPTPLDAAAEADRQLRLADLLSTAARLPDDTADPFERSVLSLAQARAAQLSPAALILHRLGARSWGGITLALLAVLTLALTTAQPPPARAATASTVPRSWRDLDLEKPLARPANPSSPDYRRPKPGTGSDENDPLQSELPTSSPPNVTPPASTDPGTHSGNAAIDSAGSGSASTPAKPRPQDPAFKITGESRANPSINRANTSTGGSSRANTGDPTQSPAGGTAAPSPNRRPAPIWRAETWQSDQVAAQSAVRDGKVPDRYRDLVKAYFQRE